MLHHYFINGMDKAVAVATKIQKEKEKKTWSNKLIAHCREHHFRVPDHQFLDLLDAFANGAVPDDIESQSDPEDSETQVVEDLVFDDYEPTTFSGKKRQQTRGFTVREHPPADFH